MCPIINSDGKLIKIMKENDVGEEDIRDMKNILTGQSKLINYDKFTIPKSVANAPQLEIIRQSIYNYLKED